MTQRHGDTEIVRVATAAQIGQVRALFEEYWTALGFTPCFQGFAEELAGLPGAYAPPDGRLALAIVGGEPAGCVALRRVDEDRGEFKRFYVRPQYRGTGTGRALLDWVIGEARDCGYREIVCHTMAVMDRALAMYERAGFERSGPHGDYPKEDAIFLRRRLG